jgi:hypothetical protein
VIELLTNLYSTQRLAAAAARAQDNGPPHTAPSRGGIPSKKALGLQLGRTVPDPSANLNTRKKFIQQLEHEPHPPTILGTLAARHGAARREDSPGLPGSPSPTQTLPGSHTLDAPRPRGTPFDCSHYCELNPGPCAIKRKAPRCQAPALTGCKHRTISIVCVPKDSHHKWKVKLS